MNVPTDPEAARLWAPLTEGVATSESEDYYDTDSNDDSDEVF
jgi:hypothetical protein